MPDLQALNLLPPYLLWVFYPPSSGISSCVRTDDTVMCLHTLAQPCYVALGRALIWGLDHSATTAFYSLGFQGDKFVTVQVFKWFIVIHLLKVKVF